MYDGPVDDGAAVATWAAAVLEGRLRSTLRSATPPLVNGGPVVVTVAATFETLVLRAPMPVLLFVHAPWCAECGTLPLALALPLPLPLPVPVPVPVPVPLPLSRILTRCAECDAIAAEVEALAAAWQASAGYPYPYPPRGRRSEHSAWRPST